MSLSHLSLTRKSRVASFQGDVTCHSYPLESLLNSSRRFNFSTSPSHSSCGFNLPLLFVALPLKTPTKSPAMQAIGSYFSEVVVV